MPEVSRELVVLVTKGIEHELSSAAFAVANGGITAGLKVYVFLVSAAVDLVRKRAVDGAHVSPFDPLKSLIDDFLRRGGSVWVCPPSAKARGYSPESFIDGVKIVGSSAVHERLLSGAASLSF
jgi:predicted peroxiredoxin